MFMQHSRHQQNHLANTFTTRMVDDVVHICIIGRASANVSILKPIQPIQLKISLDPGSLPTDNHMFILQY